MAHNVQTIIVQRRGSPGVLAGALACMFGILGIFTFGFIFVPLAALCSVVGLLRGFSGMSGAGIGLSVVGVLLTIAGFAVSPTLWVLFAAGAVHH